MRALRFLKKPLIAGLITWLFAGGSQVYASDAKQLYSRCASCHLASGAGVSGAYPPLKNRLINIAKTDLGRQYLVSVINKGLMGSIEVGQVAYNGFMPAHGHLYDANSLTQLLNYMLVNLDDQVIDEETTVSDKGASQQLLFNREEITKLLAMSVSAQDNFNLRKQLIKRYPLLSD